MKLQEVQMGVQQSQMQKIRIQLTNDVQSELVLTQHDEQLQNKIQQIDNKNDQFINQETNSILSTEFTIKDSSQNGSSKKSQSEAQLEDSNSSKLPVKKKIKKERVHHLKKFSEDNLDFKNITKSVFKNVYKFYTQNKAFLEYGSQNNDEILNSEEYYKLQKKIQKKDRLYEVFRKSINLYDLQVLTRQYSTEKNYLLSQKRQLEKLFKWLISAGDELCFSEKYSTQIEINLNQEYYNYINQKKETGTQNQTMIKDSSGKDLTVAVFTSFYLKINKDDAYFEKLLENIQEVNQINKEFLQLVQFYLNEIYYIDIMQSMKVEKKKHYFMGALILSQNLENPDQLNHF